MLERRTRRIDEVDPLDGALWTNGEATAMNDGKLSPEVIAQIAAVQRELEARDPLAPLVHYINGRGGGNIGDAKDQTTLHDREGAEDVDSRY